MQASMVCLQAVRAVKGILNKLTPEKFDVLLGQLKGIITNTEILHSSIALLFENAVAQPTFVKMYADLCDRLSKVSFPDHLCMHLYCSLRCPSAASFRMANARRCL